HDLYQVKTDCLDLGEGILIVVENDEKKCCLFVDEVIGQQQIVIKGLSSYLGHVQSISGCAILGDGDISMILDIDDLIMSAEQVKH
ncbi:chemotaxis protein CheW, partial [Pelotomaculum propionicicum]|uniref:chemotaxis protein CheW n=1 Tax=Pelotomaculum propionicicum TaxID=258475 RepID=UPI003B81675B